MRRRRIFTIWRFLDSRLGCNDGRRPGPLGAARDDSREPAPRASDQPPASDGHETASGAALPHHPAQQLSLPALEHLLHLLVLLQELVDLLHVSTGAAGDPALARAVEDLRPPALERRHRVDDRLDALEL